MLTTTTDFLSVSVEAARLRSVESDEDYFSAEAKAARRARDIEDAASFAPDDLRADWIGSDKFIVFILDRSRWGADFQNQFCLKGNKAFREVRLYSPFALFARVAVPASFTGDPAAWVADEIALGFLPF